MERWLGYHPVMHPHLDRARADHRDGTQRWLHLVGGLDGAQANWRPAPDRWSVAQCLEHVAVVSGAALAGLEGIVAERPGRAAPTSTRYGPLGRWFLAAQAPSTRARVRTPGAYRPSASQIDLEGATARFRAVQERLDAVIGAADGLDLGRVRMPSPVLPLLRLPIGIWLQALPIHALRHLEQAERVKAHPGFPSVGRG